MPKTVKRISKPELPSFIFICMDGPETLPLRLEHLQGHLEHIEANHEHYRVAGPMKNETGTIVGSFYIVAAPNREQAQSIMDGDPYMASNMYENVMVQEFVPACGAWMGGIIWDKEDLINNHPQ